MSDNEKDFEMNKSNADDVNEISEVKEASEEKEAYKSKEIPEAENTEEKETTEKAETSESNSEKNALVPICTGCGSELEPNQVFCPKCGKKDVNDIPQNSLLAVEQKPKNNKKKTIIIAACVAATVVIVIVAFILLRGTPVEKLKLDEKNITIAENGFYTLKCTVYPKNATDKKIVWYSSDKDIAKVNKKGEITGGKSGECTITATASSGVKAKCKVTVEKPAPDLLSVYNQLDSYNSNASEFCSLGDDGSYLEIDTNPNDYDDDSYLYDSTDTLKGTALVFKANSLLGLPSSVNKKMQNTSSINGTQTYSAYKLEVSWTYHPDKGLEVMYEVEK